MFEFTSFGEVGSVSLIFLKVCISDERCICVCVCVCVISVIFSYLYFVFFFFFKNINLTVPGLSCGTWNLPSSLWDAGYLVATCEYSCGMWDLVL